MRGDLRYFPEAGEVPVTFAVAFTGLMFAHARFEAEVRALQGVITNRTTFGELARNQWKAYERPQRMVELIKEYLGNDVPEAESIATVLSHAIDPCDQRNLLVHGEWWLFDSQTSTVTVRPGRQQYERQRPEHREFTERAILALAEKFKSLEAKLYNLRSAIEKRVAPTRVKCKRCLDTYWVCETHDDRPWDGERGCGCGAAGMPCPSCNISNADNPPRLPPDFEPDIAFDDDFPRLPKRPETPKR